MTGGRTLLGRVLVAVGTIGILATLVGTVVGVRLLGQLDTTLDDSVAVTATTLDALASTVDVAQDALGETITTLEDTARTTVTVRDATDATVAVLEGAADLTGEEVAESIASVQDALPALIDVASTIDTTLSALERLPIGPSYDPEVPFDDAVRDVQQQLEGLPPALREEAELLRDGADRLGAVSTATDKVTADLRVLASTLSEARDLLSELEGATDEAAAILDAGTNDLSTSITWSRILLVVVGLATAVGQLVPVLAGRMLLDPERLRALLAD